MKFVLLSPRRGKEVIAAEYDDFLTFSGLTEQQLEVRVLDQPDSSLGDFSDVTGVFIGGSPFTITDPIDDEWQPAISQRLVHFVKDATVHRRFPILSTCYGTGMFAHYMGGRVGQEHSEEPGPSVVQLTEAAEHDVLTRGLPREFLGLGAHKDSVEQLPANATLLATGPTCPVHMYRIGDNVWVTQFHPELDGDRITIRLGFYDRAGYYSEEKAKEIYASLIGHDTSAANSLISRFVTYAVSLENKNECH
ncbi:glutamine amidotransferase-related protein [Corynebacterium anserum]|uniref:Glutamine amidotransferase n=1 Tax=Corynebacterium anserum TaxID=2684406 RepID=A0A7G7YNE4_9CORY|nr:glutamine amidotransferase [Corynebacterium anserum]MBC2681575.1 glutamine amidotransferase [Corynebacterium anserum]QNH96014.1 glutamine amidotransferase [Corynebacterium anserum]